MAEEVRTRFKETLKSTKELLIAIEEASRQQEKKNAPRLPHSLDRPFDKASKTLSDFIESLDKRASKTSSICSKGTDSSLAGNSNLSKGGYPT